MSKTIIETFRNILDTYTINRLKDEKPSFVNSLSYRKYKITVELIETPGGLDYFDSHIIAANFHSECIDLAKNIASDYDKLLCSAENTIITSIGIYTGENKTPFIIHSSYIGG